MKSLLMFLSLLALGSSSRVVCGADGSRPKLLEPFLGEMLIIDIPEAYGSPPLAVASGWKLLRADDTNVDGLLALVGEESPPVVAYVDSHGNVIHVDASARCRSRISTGVKEYARRVEQIRRNLADLKAEAERAERRRRPERELGRLLQLVGTALRGYPEIGWARQRLAGLEVVRRREFYARMATEGLVPTKQLISGLADLHPRCVGLPTSAAIEAVLARLERGIIVVPRER